MSHDLSTVQYYVLFTRIFGSKIHKSWNRAGFICRDSIIFLCNLEINTVAYVSHNYTGMVFNILVNDKENSGNSNGFIAVDYDNSRGCAFKVIKILPVVLIGIVEVYYD